MLLTQVGNDPAKAAFFQQINEAIIVQDQLSVLLDQGTNFYMKLNDILIRLQQSINDYKFSRDLQKNDLLTQIGASSAQQVAAPAMAPEAQPPQAPAQPPMPGYGYGAPNMQMQGWGMPPQGYAQPPCNYGMPPQGYGQPPQGYGMPPQGYG